MSFRLAIKINIFHEHFLMGVIFVSYIAVFLDYSIALEQDDVSKQLSTARSHEDGFAISSKVYFWFPVV